MGEAVYSVLYKGVSLTATFYIVKGTAANAIPLLSYDLVFICMNSYRTPQLWLCCLKYMGIPNVSFRDSMIALMVFCPQDMLLQLDLNTKLFALPIDHTPPALVDKI